MATRTDTMANPEVLFGLHDHYLINRLGKLEPDSIAEVMRKLGIKGNHGTVNCPLARLLSDPRRRVGRKEDVYHVGVDVYWPGWHGPIKPLPQTVDRFVRNFDFGRYPDLIRKAT